MNICMVGCVQAIGLSLLELTLSLHGMVMVSLHENCMVSTLCLKVP